MERYIVKISADAGKHPMLVKATDEVQMLCWIGEPGTEGTAERGYAPHFLARVPAHKLNETALNTLGQTIETAGVDPCRCIGNNNETVCATYTLGVDMDSAKIIGHIAGFPIYCRSKLVTPEKRQHAEQPSRYTDAQINARRQIFYRAMTEQANGDVCPECTHCKYDADMLRFWCAKTCRFICNLEHWELDTCPSWCPRKRESRSKKLSRLVAG